ncbi:MAG: hypothetical protein HY901_21565 [Deltaproteobacteria bacterium]|nr:hypothetical protein [Deltaproteobacteria bacterium]
MNCPACRKKVKDGTSICPYCDAVLDESLLGAISDDTPPPAPRKPSAAQKPAARKPALVSKQSSRDATSPRPAAAKKPAYSNKYSQYWDEDTGRSASPSAASEEDGLPEQPLPDAGATRESEMVDPFVQLKGIWSGFLNLHFEDKLTTGAASFLIFTTFLPWRTTPEGDEMGLLTSGVFVFLLAIGAIASVWARRTDKLPAFPRNQFPWVTLGAGGLSALICVAAAIAAYEKSGKSVTAEPAFGVLLAVIAAAGIIVGAILTRMREL